MALQIDTRNPSDLHSALADISTTNCTEIELILRVYAPLEDRFTPKGHFSDDTFGARLLEPLYNDWVTAFRNLGHSAQNTKIKAVLDLTRPDLREPNATNFTLYESRGLMRITTLLRQTFNGAIALHAAIVGVPCWCILRECEKHVALPKAESWPVERASHVQRTGVKSGNASLCLELAREHWDDSHWTNIDGPAI